MELTKENLIDIIIDNTEYSAIDKRKKINQKQQLKKLVNNNINNTENTIFTFLFNIIQKNNLSENIINMSKVKELTNVEIRKLIKEHNDFVKIKIPKGATKKTLLKVINDKGFKVDHKNKKLVKLSGSILKKPEKPKPKFNIDESKNVKQEYKETKKEKKEKLEQSKIGDKQEKENRRLRDLAKQLDDEINQVKDEVMEYTKQKTLNKKDFDGLTFLKESLDAIVEEYKDEDIEMDMDKDKVKKLYKLIDLMLSAGKKEATNLKVDKKPDENVQGKKSQSSMQRKGRKPSESKPVVSSKTPSKASALPQRKTRGKIEKGFVKVEKPKFTIDKSKQPKTTPSKIDFKIKPPLSTKKIVPKKKEKEATDEEVYGKDVVEKKEEEVDTDDINKLPLEDKLALLDTFVEKYNNNITSQGQDIFEDRKQAQKFFRKTFEAIKKISQDANRNNLGFQGVSMSIQKPANRLLNKLARNSDEEMKTGITLITTSQPIRHFVRYISTSAKDIKKQKKTAGKKGILKDDMPKYKGYSAIDLNDILRRNNLKQGGSRFEMINRILNNDIKLPPKATKDKKEKGVKIKVAEKPKEPEPPPADDTESEEEEETEEERKERERISDNNMKNIDIMKNIVSALARTFKQRITLDQKEYELTDEQIQDVRDKILSRDPLEILEEYRKYNNQLKNMEDTFRGKKLKKSLKNLKFLIDDIVRANQKNYKDTFVKKDELRKPDKDDIPEFDIGAFIQESMKQALDNAEQEQEIDDDEDEEELTDINDDRVQELIKRMKRTMNQLEERIPKFTDKKDLGIIHKEINKNVQDWSKEFNVYLDDDLDEIVVEKLKDKLRTFGRDIIKKKQADKEYLESFRGVKGSATDPAGTTHEWRTQKEYGEISGIVHKALLQVLERTGNTESSEFKEWEKFRGKTLPDALDKFYKEVDRRN